MKKYYLEIFFLSGLVTLVYMPAPVMAEPAVTAHAEITGCGDSTITGRAELKEQRSEEGIKQIDVRLMVNGLSDGKHAVHIHEFAKCKPCGAAGGHYDPGPYGMSNPDGNHPFHSGDLVNLISKNGEGTLQATTTRITLSPGPLSLFDADGSAFIIHTNEDTYCPEGVTKGCAGGSREACGIIVPDQ